MAKLKMKKLPKRELPFRKCCTNCLTDPCLFSVDLWDKTTDKNGIDNTVCDKWEGEAVDEDDPDICCWTKNNVGSYDSSCGCCGPYALGFTYCPYCGKPLHVN